MDDLTPPHWGALADPRDATDAYRWGWDWAALGMELHGWLLPHLGTTQMEAAQQGWQDYHDYIKKEQTDAD